MNTGFREDLHYRLNVVTVWLPTLAERKEDIPLLTDYFLRRLSAQCQVPNPGLTRDALLLLSEYEWPGNVRELGNVLQKALLFSRGLPLDRDDIEQSLERQRIHRPIDADGDKAILEAWVRDQLKGARHQDLFESCMHQCGALLIREALKMTGGNRSKAARLPGLSRPTLHAKIDKYNLKFSAEVQQ